MSAKTNPPSLEEQASINPMITPDGGTYRVSSALVALACLLAEDQAQEPDSARDFGIAVILETCAAALRKMDEGRSA